MFFSYYFPLVRLSLNDPVRDREYRKIRHIKLFVVDDAPQPLRRIGRQNRLNLTIVALYFLQVNQRGYAKALIKYHGLDEENSVYTQQPKDAYVAPERNMNINYHMKSIQNAD